MSAVIKTPIVIIDSITEIIESRANLTSRVINGNGNTPETVDTIIKKYLNLFDIAQTYSNNMLPKQPIITTFMYKENKIRENEYSVLKKRLPEIYTEVCSLNFNEEYAVLENYNLALEIEAAIEGTDVYENFNDLGYIVKNLYVNSIERLGVKKFSEKGFHASHRLYYKIDYFY